MNESPSYKNPTWWKDEHTSAWDRTKEALRRDWEQTKADVSSGGKELNQDVGDTLKQAAGKQAIPPGNAANPPDNWNDAEPGIRYGYGAARQYQGQDWNDGLESKLKADWHGAGNEGTWDHVKSAVRRGWDSAKRAVS